MGHEGPNEGGRPPFRYHMSKAAAERLGTAGIALIFAKLGAFEPLSDIVDDLGLLPKQNHDHEHDGADGPSGGAEDQADGALDPVDPSDLAYTEEWYYEEWVVVYEDIGTSWLDDSVDQTYAESFFGDPVWFDPPPLDYTATSYDAGAEDIAGSDLGIDWLDL